MFLESLAEKCGEISGLKAFAARFPPCGDDCLCVSEYAAEFSKNGVNYGFINRHVQIMARASGYRAAYTALKAVMEELDSGPDEREIDIGGEKAVSRPKHIPLYIGEDEDGKVMLGMNYVITTRFD